MNQGNKNGICHMPYATVATGATHSMVFDTKGFDYLNLYVGMNTHATNKAALSTLKITESDTLTSISSQSAIVALTGGTVTSSSVGFVIPNATKMGPGAVVEFQVDLKARKRFLGLQVTPGDTTAKGSQALALLGRPGESKDSYTEKYVKNYAATSSTACAKVVTA